VAVPGRSHLRPSMTTARSRKKSDPSHCFDRCSPSGRAVLGHCETDRDSFIVLRPRLRNVITCVYVTLRSISLVGTIKVQRPADGELTCAFWLACGNSPKAFSLVEVVIVLPITYADRHLIVEYLYMSCLDNLRHIISFWS
jgi:hypothetical protein